MSDRGAAFQAYKRDLKMRAPIEDVIAREMTIGDQGSGKKVGLCPFHNEKTESFFVYYEDEYPHYHCFGCGAHGDAIGFYIRYHRADFWEAIDALADQAGMPHWPRNGGDLTPAHYAKAEQEAKNSTASPSLEERQAAARAKAERREAFMVDLALDLWRRGQFANGTLAEVYFRARCGDVGLIGGVPASLRFIPSLPLSLDKRDPAYRERRPAIVAGVQRPSDGKVQAVHLTYLQPDGRDRYRGDVLVRDWETGAVVLDDDGAPKRVLPSGKRIVGPVTSCAIRLSPAAEIMASSEGVENGIAAMIDAARAGDPIAVWVALNIGNIAGAGDAKRQRKAKNHPTLVHVDKKTGEWRPQKIPTKYPDMQRPGIILPAVCKHWIILGDADSDPINTDAMYQRATRRQQAEGRKVSIAWPEAGKDFTDMAQK